MQRSSVMDPVVKFPILENNEDPPSVPCSINSEEEKSSRDTLLDNQGTKYKARNYAAFWLFGLTNNFGYVIMLSAAFDILGKQIGTKKEHHEKGYHCNPASTGVILLADVLPGMLIKWTAPFYMQAISYNIRIAFVVLVSIGSYILVALSSVTTLSILGVVFASISSCCGELTFLSLTSHFDKNVVSTWSSGTGAAGLFGSLSYAGLTTAGMSPRNTILLMLIIPLIMAASFWILLIPDASVKKNLISVERQSLLRTDDKTMSLTLKEKLYLMKPLLKYMIPLFLVYFAEYLINQGLYELLYYGNSSLNHSEQYRWFQTDYQFGVFISRSSINLIQIKKIEILTALQYAIFIFLLLEVYYRFTTTIWIVLAVILIEGLLGGGVYVNSFYRISHEVPEEHREFSMGAASMADSTGITLAGLISVPLHTYLCKYSTTPK